METNYWNNAVKRIELYKKDSTWFFDDKYLKIVGEPFVCGASEAIQMIVDKFAKDKEHPVIIFSETEIPGYDAHIVIKQSFGNNASYMFEEHELWLCPVLTSFFPVPPKNIYIKVEQ